MAEDHLRKPYSTPSESKQYISGNRSHRTLAPAVGRNFWFVCARRADEPPKLVDRRAE
jgi:hypothetical protein